jgi:hypothetical protein
MYASKTLLSSVAHLAAYMHITKRPVRIHKILRNHEGNAVTDTRNAANNRTALVLPHLNVSFVVLPIHRRYTWYRKKPLCTRQQCEEVSDGHCYNHAQLLWAYKVTTLLAEQTMTLSHSWHGGRCTRCFVRTANDRTQLNQLHSRDGEAHNQCEEEHARQQ